MIRCQQVVEAAMPCEAILLLYNRMLDIEHHLEELRGEK
jgi:hypothetical protein